eukprot:6456129-Amphidinium_carterae.1
MPANIGEYMCNNDREAAYNMSRRTTPNRIRTRDRKLPHVPNLADEAYDFKQQRGIIGGWWVVQVQQDRNKQHGIIGWWWVVKPVQDDETTSPGHKPSSRHAAITPSAATYVDDKKTPHLFPCLEL